MPSAALLRMQIEQALERRFPAALSPAPQALRETAPTGIAEVDKLLEGGLPIGAISEVTGPECSGRTSLALKFLGRRMQVGHVCAWVDVQDALDAESAAANGVCMKQLLWVRCSGERIGQKKDGKPWARLDQALRATDLLLQAGGYAAIVLDMGGMAAEYARRIPLATWFRFRQAAQRTQCSLVVIGQRACAQSSADVVLECKLVRANSDTETVLSGIRYEVRRERARGWGGGELEHGFQRKSESDSSAETPVPACGNLYAFTSRSGAAQKLGYADAEDAPAKTLSFAPRLSDAPETPSRESSPDRRKPPGSTWSAAGAWDREKRA